MEKISVIIPVYNTEKYLDKRFESILNQTYTNIEIIVINDGSNKKTKNKLKKITKKLKQTYTKLEIIIINDKSNKTTSNKLKQFAKEDQRIRLFELPEREGVGHARNYALTKATGKYIYYFDSDDSISQNTLDLLVTY